MGTFGVKFVKWIGILKPHPTESQWIIKMFELRCRGTLGDHQIVAEINKLGFKTRTDYVRDPKDRTKIIREHGGNPLDIKGFWRYIQNPIYAGISAEKWTEGQRVKGKYEGIVSIETFNKANKGKVTIVEENGEVKIYKKQPEDWRVKKGVRNPDFPYKRYVMCSHCKRPLYGSASKGRLGKYYPAYHCSKDGHNFRVPKADFEATIEKFVNGIDLAPGYKEELVKAVTEEWDKRQNELQKDDVNIDQKIIELKTQAKMTADKIKFLTSEVAIRYMEEDLVKTEGQIAELLAEKQKVEQEKPTDVRIVMAYIKYFLEHMEELLLESPNPLDKAGYFGVLFDKAPTYAEIDSETRNLASCIALNEVFVRSQGKLAGTCG